MEEELNYVTVVFKTKEEPRDMDDYEDIKTVEQTLDTSSVLPENKKKAPLCTLLHLVAAGLGIICVLLVSAVITLSIHFNTVMSEQYRENTNLTSQNLQLWTEKTNLERRTEELTREKDGLNWTISVIMEHDMFQVTAHCPQKVCQPCLDGWVQFQSSCYFFFDNSWKSWERSRDKCKEINANLVVIESQEEQEFINNHTKDQEDYGYWIGLSSKDVMGKWMWVNGRNVSVMYWRTQEPLYGVACALIQPHATPLANWNKAHCDKSNHWICERRTLIKESAAQSKLIV
ncbi:C-type lectin domain family 4 member M-like isoform X2 [Dicentrarchus labrax]|uniref:C-type lectin domain family 4 member M-like isoform X2 n=1 Tax=Dicentrarchus labrax TaxID=13489 RepID=UPI0021F61207|nr:C-type lectin domain family 4 member M-like isoform X2 [Dicentrarchus labrax]